MLKVSRITAKILNKHKIKILNFVFISRIENTFKYIFTKFIKYFLSVDFINEYHI